MYICMYVIFDFLPKPMMVDVKLNNDTIVYHDNSIIICLAGDCYFCTDMVCSCRCVCMT